MRKEFVWRWTFFLGGVLLMSLGISMTIKGQCLELVHGMYYMLVFINI